LKDAGDQRIASFDLLNGFRALEPGDDSFLTQLGLTPTNGAAAGGLDLLSATLERLVGADGPPAVLIIDFASRLIARNEALSPAEHQLFSRALILSHSARARPAGDRRLPFFNTVIWIALNRQIWKKSGRRSILSLATVSEQPKSSFDFKRSLRRCPQRM